MGLTSDMQTQTFLQKRDTTYYLRRKIPVDLQPYYGKVEIKISRRTKDRKEAGRLVRQKSAELDQEFDHVRSLVKKVDWRDIPGAMQGVRTGISGTLCDAGSYPHAIDDSADVQCGPHGGFFER